MKILEISCLCIEILHYVQDDIAFDYTFLFETTLFYWDKEPHYFFATATESAAAFGRSRA